MLARRLSLLLGSLLVIAHVHAARAAPLHNRIDVSIEAIVNPVAGSPGAKCVATGEVALPGKIEWWIAFGEARPHPQMAWEATGTAVRCGARSLAEALSDLERRPEKPYLVIAVSTTASRLPERVDLLEMSVTSRKLSGFGGEGEPVYRTSVEKRNFFASKTGETFVPLLVANSREERAFEVHELLMRVEAKQAREEEAYGVISVTSSRNGAKVLLDGGVVASISPGRETVLRTVRAGEREVAVRDSSGREARRLVLVEANRTYRVSLSPSGESRNSTPFGLVSLGKNARGHEEYRRERDGAVVVKVSAGEFLMGNTRTERSPREHKVYVSDFLMDRTGVTWGQYKRFAAATGTALPPDEPWWGIHDDHPVVFVTWEEAKSYCEWAGGRLPTEAEREKACRGTDDRMYPWGNEEPDPERAVFRRSWGFAATDPVGTHPKGASPYGVLDLGGSTWEWCEDWYDEKYYEGSPPRDPTGPHSGHSRVVRGGSWDSRPTVLSCSCRSWGNRGYREGDFGFRCAMDVPE